MTEPLLDRTTLQRAFVLLAERLERRKAVGVIHVFGGAAMVLAFNSRSATRDIDALFTPDTAVRDAAREVARVMHLPESWLNNQASSYVSARVGPGTPVFEHSHLRVLLTPIDHLLAMKVRAARAVRDAEDIQVLLTHLNIQTMQEVAAVVATFFPSEPLSRRSRDLVRDLLSRVQGGGASR